LAEPEIGTDEAFWRAVEKRKKDQLGQPCCTQSGMSWTMIDMPGNFAVVIHGEYDCVNCFHHHIGRSAVQYYSTRLTEEMLTTGRTEAALRTCLELIAEQQRPEVVIVLGTCPVEVIGDQFGPVVEAVSARTGIPMIPLRTSGLRLSSQQQMLDWLFSTLAALPEAPPVDRYWQREVARMAMEVLFDAHAGSVPVDRVLARLRQVPEPAALHGVDRSRRVNLIGMPSGDGALPEPIVLLGAAGVEVNGAFPEGASITEWRAIRHAGHAMVVDTSMYPKLIDVLRSHGMGITEVPLPVGLGPSSRFYGAVATATGIDLSDALEPLQTLAEAALARARTQLAGLRVGVTIRMLANYNSDNLAYEGIGEVEALQEMGLDVTLLVQGPPEAKARESFGEGLRARGCDLPFDVFGGPWILAEHLQRGRFDLVICSDTVRNEARAVSVPMLTTRSMAPYLAGVPGNVDLVLSALRGRLRGEAG
jgi:nitrogenase molybdenum-iron protein alpha/beta subunit